MSVSVAHRDLTVYALINMALLLLLLLLLLITPKSEFLLVGLLVTLIVTIIPGRVLRMHKQSGVHVHSEYAFAKLCQE